MVPSAAKLICELLGSGVYAQGYTRYVGKVVALVLVVVTAADAADDVEEPTLFVATTVNV
jgi:hypothetical protein